MKNRFVLIDEESNPEIIYEYGKFDSMKEALDFKAGLYIHDRDQAHIVSEATFEEMIGIQYVVVRTFEGMLCNVGMYTGPTGALAVVRESYPTSGQIMTLDAWNSLPVLKGQDPERRRKLS